MIPYNNTKYSIVHSYLYFSLESDKREKQIETFILFNGYGSNKQDKKRLTKWSY